MNKLDLTNARNRLPSDEDYLRALGLASYAFTRCEWEVVWCCEEIKPGVLHIITNGNNFTAGKIGGKFFHLVRNMERSVLREQLFCIAQEFLSLVKERNRIIHGKPCTSPNGQDRLNGNGVIEIEDLEKAADGFAACEIKLNSIRFKLLKK